jgi:TPR repeat protein
MSDKDVKAAQLFRKAAEAGSPEGQFEFGLCLRDGKGVPQDLAGAKDWFRKAAGAGHAEAAQALSEPQSSQPSPLQTPATGTSPAGTKPHQPTQDGGAGFGCAVIACVVGLFVFANSCTTTIPGGFFAPATKETDWPAALVATAIVTVMAYACGKNSK